MDSSSAVELYELRMVLETAFHHLTAANFDQGLYLLEQLLAASETDEAFCSPDAIFVADEIVAQPVLLGQIAQALRCRGHVPRAINVVRMLSTQAMHPAAPKVLASHFMKLLLRAGVEGLANSALWSSLDDVIGAIQAVATTEALHIVAKGYLPLLMAWAVQCAPAASPSSSALLSLLLCILTDGDTLDVALVEPAALNVTTHQFAVFCKWIESSLLPSPVCVTLRVRNVAMAVVMAAKRVVQYVERGECERAKQALQASSTVFQSISCDAAPLPTPVLPMHPAVLLLSAPKRKHSAAEPERLVKRECACVA